MNDQDVWSTAVHISTAFYEARAEMMAGFGWRQVLDVAVAATGLAVMFICMCRIRLLTPAHRLLPRITYAGLMTGGFCLAFAPWLFGPSYVRTGSLLFSVAVVAHLVAVGHEWLHGRPPSFLESDRAPLEDRDAS